MLERRLAKEPERFGNGAIEGVAGPESANNAAAQSSFVPLLSLGIPANAVMGVILGALLIQGITPGPTLVANRPDIFFGVIASMIVGNLMLIVLNVPLISIFVQLLRLPGAILAPLIIVFCVVGAYTLSNNVVEVIIMIGFGIAGYPDAQGRRSIRRRWCSPSCSAISSRPISARRCWSARARCSCSIRGRSRPADRVLRGADRAADLPRDQRKAPVAARAGPH